MLPPPLSTAFDVHLQWFAAEDEGRTEEPSEHKLRKAREEGKVAKSVEVTSAVMLLAGILAVALLSGSMLRTMLAMLTWFFSNAASPNAFSGAMVRVFLSFLVRISLPLLVIMFIVAVAGNVIQVGFLFTTKPITPDASRIVPRFGRWLQRAFGSTEALFNLAKSIIKVAVIAVIAYLNIRGEIPRLTRLALAPFFSGVALVSSVALRIVLEAAVLLLAFGAFDYWFQRRQHLEALKMSRQEVKEERKMYEGDPLVRSRVRERMREIMRRNMLKAVPKADVVITNPTHYAVALEYDRAVMAAPTVTAKGADIVAAKIREVAAEHRVPLVENRPLAQALWREVDIGDPVPEKFYEVISIVLAEVYRAAGRSARAAEEIAQGAAS
ncbi:MAG: flagellar biosynthesis protein FlhB [Spirochaetes bacterium RBG_13_68_11]|nr:MAG: flagellar biosynthesis protein FlhB [Spirochaetes bacterium RBG_13_68_11]